MFRNQTLLQKYKPLFFHMDSRFNDENFNKDFVYKIITEYVSSSNIPQMLVDNNFVNEILTHNPLENDIIKQCNLYNFVIDVSSQSSRTFLRNKIISIYTNKNSLNICSIIPQSFIKFLDSITNI
jgi:hypothetical protein